MRVDVFRPAFLGRLHFRLNFLFVGRTGRGTGELTAQLRNDRLREFGLDREHVFQITSKILRPEFLACVGAGKPRRDPHRYRRTLRTLPSTRCATPSFCPISWAVAFLPLNENADVRAATCIPGIFCSTVKSSSLTPSEKYSLPLSSLRLTNGRTATDF